MQTNTDVVRISNELGQIIAAHDGARPLTEVIAARVREERFVERCLLVSYLTLALPDTTEMRDALVKVFGGEHRRNPVAVEEATATAT